MDVLIFLSLNQILVINKNKHLVPFKCVLSVLIMVSCTYSTLEFQKLYSGDKECIKIDKIQKRVIFK